MTWTLWRRRDTTGRVERASSTDDAIGRFDGRIGALAAMLTWQCEDPAGTYAVEGPSQPVCRTNRDLYLVAVGLGRQMVADAWSLSAYLRSLWRLSGVLSSTEELDLDTVAAFFTAASRTSPPGVDPRWRAADLTGRTSTPLTLADWRVIVLSQIADLEDFADQPPGPAAYLGVRAPRPEGLIRATPADWYNFDPATYLECGLTATLGGWDPGDGTRTIVPGATGDPGTDVEAIESLSWADLCEIAICGQLYE